MLDRVPALPVKQPGPGLRALGLFVPGIREVSAQVGPYTRWWNDQNQAAVSTDGPLWVVIGDSTGLGIGASSPDRGYVGILGRALHGLHGRRWRIINLGMSGGRVDDAVDRQLPILATLPPPDLVTMCIGTNDVVWTSAVASLRRRLGELVTGLPAGSVVARVAGGSGRARLANRAIQVAARAGGHHIVDPWRVPGPSARRRLAADRFHPNDLGYALMARAFGPPLGVPETDLLHE